MNFFKFMFLAYMPSVDSRLEYPISLLTFPPTEIADSACPGVDVSAPNLLTQPTASPPCQ